MNALRGAAVASFALIVLYVVVQPGSSGKATQGLGLLTTLLDKAMSPLTAGVPARGDATIRRRATAPAATPPATVPLPAPTDWI